MADVAAEPVIVGARLVVVGGVGCGVGSGVGAGVGAGDGPGVGAGAGAGSGFGVGDGVGAGAGDGDGSGFGTVAGADGAPESLPPPPPQPAMTKLINKVSVAIVGDRRACVIIRVILVSAREFAWREIRVDHEQMTRRLLRNRIA